MKKKICYEKTVNKTLELIAKNKRTSIKARIHYNDYINSKNAHSHKHLPSNKYFMFSHKFKT